MNASKMGATLTQSLINLLVDVDEFAGATPATEWRLGQNES